LPTYASAWLGYVSSALCLGPVQAPSQKARWSLSGLHAKSPDAKASPPTGTRSVKSCVPIHGDAGPAERKSPESCGIPPTEKCHDPPFELIVPLQKMARLPSGETRGRKTPSIRSIFVGSPPNGTASDQGLSAAKLTSSVAGFPPPDRKDAA